MTHLTKMYSLHFWLCMHFNPCIWCSTADRQILGIWKHFCSMTHYETLWYRLFNESWTFRDRSTSFIIYQTWFLLIQLKVWKLFSKIAQLLKHISQRMKWPPNIDLIRLIFVVKFQVRIMDIVLCILMSIDVFFFFFLIKGIVLNGGMQCVTKVCQFHS